MTDTINIDGYTVTIETEYCPENPFEAWLAICSLPLRSPKRSRKAKGQNE